MISNERERDEYSNSVHLIDFTDRFLVSVDEVVQNHNGHGKLDT